VELLAAAVDDAQRAHQLGFHGDAHQPAARDLGA
jgi:hypothetical protein